MWPGLDAETCYAKSIKTEFEIDAREVWEKTQTIIIGFCLSYWIWIIFLVQSEEGWGQALERHIASECIYGHPLHLGDRQIIHRCEGGGSSPTNIAIQILKHKYRNSACLKITQCNTHVGQWRLCPCIILLQIQSHKYWNTPTSTHLYDGGNHSLQCTIGGMQ